MSAPRFEGWAVLEIMGHRQVAGYVRDVDLFGARMCQVDVPEQPAVPAGARYFGEPELPAIPAFTQYFGGTAIFSCTPCTEEQARSAATRMRYGAGLAELVPSSRQLGEMRDMSRDAEFTPDGEDIS